MQLLGLIRAISEASILFASVRGMQMIIGITEISFIKKAAVMIRSST